MHIYAKEPVANLIHRFFYFYDIFHSKLPDVLLNGVLMPNTFCKAEAAQEEIEA